MKYALFVLLAAGCLDRGAPAEAPDAGAPPADEAPPRWLGRNERSPLPVIGDDVQATGCGGGGYAAVAAHPAGGSVALGLRCSLSSEVNDRIWVVRYKPDGGVQWTREFPWIGHIYVGAVKVADDGAIFIAGNTHAYHVAARLAPDGTIVWFDKTIHDGTNQIQTTSSMHLELLPTSGDLLLSANSSIARVSRNGGTLWSRAGVKRAVATPDGNIYAVGESEVRAYTANGDLRWTRPIASGQRISASGNDRIFAGAYNATHAFDAAGTPLWTNAGPDDALAGVPGGDVVVVDVVEDTIARYAGTTGARMWIQPLPAADQIAALEIGPGAEIFVATALTPYLTGYYDVRFKVTYLAGDGRLFGTYELPTALPKLTGTVGHGTRFSLSYRDGQLHAVTGEDQPPATPPSPPQPPSALTWTSRGIRLTFMLDRDADGLLDVWETSGIDVDGVPPVDLVLPGADPDHKDIYVEVDRMDGFYDPSEIQEALDLVKARFALAPSPQITNPDGQQGIRLHVDVGGTVPPQIFRDDATTDNVWAKVELIKANHFGTAANREARKLAYRYSLFADHVERGTYEAYSGRAELRGNDTLIFLGGGAWGTFVGAMPRELRVKMLAGTFMHELGHNLGLRDGGLDDVGYKPNYHSVMNHAMQLPATPSAAQQAIYGPIAATWKLDYSRWPSTVDETGYVESMGVSGDPNNAGRQVLVCRPSGALMAAPSIFGFDLDGDGGAPETVPYAAPINLNCLEKGGTAGQVLISYDDWAALSLTGYFGNPTQWQDGVVADPLGDELTLDDQHRLSGRCADVPAGAPCACAAGETQTCGTDVGECTAGSQACADHTWGTCAGAIGPTPETCDAQDDDCNGVTDDGFGTGASCSAGLGACLRTGTVVCTADGSGAQCSAVAAAPTAEICNDGIDQDCNGAADDGCTVAAALAQAPWNGLATGPAAAARARKPTFRWLAAAGAVRYELQVDDSCTTATFASCTFPSPELAESVTALEYTPVSALPVSTTAPVGRRYFWRVRACATAACSPWSATRYLDVGRLADDFNGDGRGDLLAGAPYQDNPESNEGRVFVYAAGANGPPATPTRTLENPRNQAESHFGWSVAAVGDLNGDGYADAIVGAYGTAAGADDEGNAYVYHGSASGLPATPSRTLDHPTNLAGAGFGWNVAAAGDVNGDGYADVIIGARYQPAAYIYHGASGGLPTAPARKLTSPHPSANKFTSAIDGAVDFDGDGYCDVAVSATDYDGAVANEGAVFIFPGGAGGVSATASFTLVNPGHVSAGFGHSIATGDVQGDGYGDLAVGAPNRAAPAANEGGVYTFHGGSGGLSAQPASVIDSPTNQAGANFGEALAFTRNEHGQQDLAVGSPNYDTPASNEGRIDVFFGATTGTYLVPARTLTMPGDVPDARLGGALGCSHHQALWQCGIVAGAFRTSAGATLEGNVLVWDDRLLAPRATLDSPNNQAFGSFGFDVD